MLEVGVQSAFWYNPNDIDGSFAYIKACGFEAVDFSMGGTLPGANIKSGELTTFFDQSVEEILAFYRPVKEASEKYGVKISQVHAPFPLWVKKKADDPDYDAEKINAYVVMAVEKNGCGVRLP